MAKLYFHVGADYENVIRLRNEIARLKKELTGMDGNTPPAVLRAMEVQLAQNIKEMDELVVTAARVGNEIDQNFKKKIFDASQTVNGFTDKIIAQKNVVKDVEADVRRLGEAYRLAAKSNPMSATSKLSEYNASKRALEGERAALFGLTQEQAKSRLSVKSLRDEYSLYNNDSTKVVSANEDIAGSLKHMVLTVAGADAIKDFISNVLTITGDFQKMEAVLTNTLGSASKAKDAIDMLADFGATTPFQVNELTSSFVKLANQGFTPTAEEMRKLGDLASSTGKSFDQLSEAILDAQTNEFERLKEFGIRASKNGDQVMFSFKEQQTTVKNTASAIREYILSLGDLEGVVGANEKISATFVGRLSNIEDELTNQFKDFGERFNAELSTGINLTGSLVENLNNIIPVIGGLVAAYGSYKAAVLAVSAAHKAGALYENIRLIAMMRKEIGMATAAQQAFNVASKANIYAALISLLLGLGAAVYIFTKRTKEASKVQESLANLNNKVTEEFSKQSATIDRLNSVLKSETSSIEQKKKSLSELQAIIPSYNAKLDEEGKLINNNTEAIKSYLTQLEKQIKLKAAQEELENLYRQKRLQEKEVQEKKLGVESATKNVPDVVYGGESGIEYQRHMLNAAGKAEGALKKANLELNTTKRLIGEIETEIELSTSSTTEIIPSSISDEIDTATKKVSTLKQELSDLRNGKTSAEAGKTVKDTIDAKLTELKTAENALSTLTGKDTATDKKASDEQKKALEARKKLNEELLSLHIQNQQAEINLMAEGRDKRLAQIEFDYDSEIAVILAKEKEWKEAQGGKLTEDQTKEVHGAFFNSYVKKEKSATLVDKDQLDAEKKAMNEYLKEYGDYLKKRQAIIELYDEKIAKATTEGDGLSLGKDKERELDAVDDLYLNSAMNRVTMEEDAAYKMLELKQDQFVTDSVYQLKRNALEKKFAQQKMSILKSTNTQEGTERHKQIEDEKKQLAGHLEYLDGYGEKLKGEIIQDALSGLSDIVGAIGGLNDDLGETMQSLQQMIGAVAQLASGNYIGAAVSAITSVVSSIAKSNQEVIQKAKETEGLYWDAVNWKIERQIKLMKELQGISSDQVNQSIQAQIEELMDALYDADFKYKGKSGADMKWMVENIWGGYKNAVATGNELAQKVLEGMAKEIEDNTIGDKKFEDVLKGLTADELISLQGMPDVWRILPEEVRNYIKQLSDAVDKQKELEEETIEMWAGTDVQTAIDDFANALVEAYAQGEDGAIAMADTTKKVLANAVKEALKKKFLADALQGAVTQLGKDMEDGDLSPEDKERFEDSANAAGKRFTEAMKMYDDLFKGENAESDREATAKGFATMSQSSADELDGKFASQLIFLDKTLGKVTTISEQMQFIRDLQVKGWEDVRAIRDLTVKVEDNTRQLAEMSEKIENNTDRTARAAESMNDSGIILRK